MASVAQVESNRLNAARSTGPRSAGGKARCSRNATTLGLFARDLLLVGEDAEQLEQLRAALVQGLHPVNAAEAMIVEQIVAANWKLQRLARAERDYFTLNGEGNLVNATERERLGLEPTRNEKIKNRWEFISPDVPVAVVIASRLGRSDALESFAKHEQRLENMIHRSLRQLRDLRKATLDRSDEPIWQNEAESDGLETVFPLPVRGERVGERVPPSSDSADGQQNSEPSPLPSPCVQGEGESVRQNHGVASSEARLISVSPDSITQNLSTNPAPTQAAPASTISKNKPESAFPASGEGTSDNFAVSIKPKPPRADNRYRLPRVRPTTTPGDRAAG